jgi:Holliday junction resolvasome RuvABC endonuclease subunit
MSERPAILALDLSLTATGWACGSISGVLKANDARAVNRLCLIRNAVLRRVRNEHTEPIDLVVLEGYAFGRLNQAHQLGELGGVVRGAHHEAGVPVAIVPPSSVKLFATGKGNAPKDQMLAEAVRVLGYQGHDHNEADARWLWTMAQAHYRGIRPSTQKQRDALAKITWPAIEPSSVAP